MRKLFANLCRGLGVICIIAALVIAWRNSQDERIAMQSADTLSEQVRVSIEAAKAVYAEADNTVIPDYILNPDIAMPAVDVGGKQVIGEVIIPSQDLELPVQAEWSVKDAKNAPCRYKGSAYTDDMIIAGHNYKSHFQRLANLTIGDEVRFRDMDGNEFQYTVSEIQDIPGEDISSMSAGEWDLTLFTCTYGGRSRVTIRCTRLSANERG